MCNRQLIRPTRAGDKLRRSDGVAKLRLSSGEAEKSSIYVRVQGRFLPVPGLPFAAGTGGRVQVINDETGVCFQAVFGAPRCGWRRAGEIHGGADATHCIAI